MHRFSLPAAALAALLLLPCLSSAQSMVDKQILRIAIILAADGYDLDRDIAYSELGDDGSEFHTLKLEKGNNYRIFAVCDGDCGDIDLCLYDENDNRIDCDVLEDDKPIVDVAPKWTGNFRVKITIPECRVAPCRYGLGVFVK